MLQKLRERLILILIILLPFHAFGVTFVTKLLRGQDNAPLPVLAFWKESLILLVAIIILLELVSAFHKNIEKGKPFIVSIKSILRLDLLDFIVIAFFAVAAIVTLFEYNGIGALLFGIKYDLFPIAVFFMLRKVAWSEDFFPKALKCVVAVGFMVAVYGIISLFMPMSFFRFFGYSDLHSLYRPNAPLPAFQQIGSMGLRRIQSTFSGPNQFGLWLLLPWSAGLFGLTKICINRESFFRRLFSPSRNINTVLGLSIFFVLCIGTALLCTFSRSAWIAAFIILILVIIFQYDVERAKRILVRLIGFLLVAMVLLLMLAPNVLLRASSTLDHLIKPMEGVRVILHNPLGLGLGSAGPASNRVSDSCVFLEQNADISWASDRYDLCVFVGGRQMQPIDRECNCPFIIENWYLQIGVELGIAGLILFVALLVIVLIKLRKYDNAGSFIVFCAFSGVALAGLFLHSFEDSAVAYTVWVLAGIGLVSNSNRLTEDAKD